MGERGPHYIFRICLTVYIFVFNHKQKTFLSIPQTTELIGIYWIMIVHCKILLLREKIWKIWQQICQIWLICDIICDSHRTTFQSVNKAVLVVQGNALFIKQCNNSQTCEISESRTFEISCQKKSVAVLSSMTHMQI